MSDDKTCPGQTASDAHVARAGDSPSPDHSAHDVHSDFVGGITYTKALIGSAKAAKALADKLAKREAAR